MAANAPASVTNYGHRVGWWRRHAEQQHGERRDERKPGGTPNLGITKTHAGNFTQGQTGATYSLAVSNAGTGPTSGTVTVTDTLPTGLTATAIAGTGWSCTLSPR